VTIVSNLTWDQARFYANGGDGAGRRRIRRAGWGGRDKRGEGLNVWLSRPYFLWWVDVSDMSGFRVVQSYDFEEQEFRANDWQVEFPPNTSPPTPPPPPPEPPFEPPTLPPGNCDCNGGLVAWGDPHFVIVVDNPLDPLARSVTAMWDDNHVPATGIRTLLLRSGGVEVWYATEEGGPPGGMVIADIWVIEPGQSDRRFRIINEECVEIVNDTPQAMTEPWARTIALQTGGQCFVQVNPINRGGAPFFELDCDFVAATRCLVREMGGGLGWAYQRMFSELRPVIGPRGVGTGLNVDGWSWLGAPLGLKRSSIQFPSKGPLFNTSPQFWGRICGIPGVPACQLARLLDFDPLLWSDWSPSAAGVCALETVPQTRTNLLCGDVQTRTVPGQLPPQWRIIETGDGVTYEEGGPGLFGEPNPPGSWTPPPYSYTGFMELQMRCGEDGEWETIQQWTTINGGPTTTLSLYEQFLAVS
jgi:hypothetical protein